MAGLTSGRSYHGISVRRIEMDKNSTIKRFANRRMGAMVGIILASAGVGSGLAFVPSSAISPLNASNPDYSSTASFPHMDHVFVIMMENTSFSDLLNPSNANTSYIRNLASSYGLETNYFGVTHTSLPNYIASTSGSTWQSNTDDPKQAPLFNHQNIVDEMETAKVSWKGYMESLPFAGDLADYGSYTGTPSSPGNALYVRKHDPFLMYPDVYDNPRRAQKVVPLSQLNSDLASGNVPEFSWISPNVCNDMHGMSGSTCPYASTSNPANQEKLYSNGNAFVKKWVTTIMKSRAWTGNSTIFITWDEGSYSSVAPYQPLDLRGGPDSPRLPSPPVNSSTGSGGDLAGSTIYGGGHVPMIVVSRLGARSVTSSSWSDHYSLLRTIEENFNLPFLGYSGDSVQVHSLAGLLAPATKDSRDKLEENVQE